eukprot:COSAG06_NODE_49380_length_325_cov_27.318584_1_plen_33_part_10
MVVVASSSGLQLVALLYGRTWVQSTSVTGPLTR